MELQRLLALIVGGTVYLCGAGAPTTVLRPQHISHLSHPDHGQELGRGQLTDDGAAADYTLNESLRLSRSLCRYAKGGARATFLETQPTD